MFKLKLVVLTLIMINVFQDPAYHKLDFHFFTLTTTIDWYKIELEGIDSYAGSITNKIDTLSPLLAQVCDLCLISIL